VDQRIVLEIPDLKVSAVATMRSQRAPRTCVAIWDALAEPVERRLIHATVSGPAVLFYDLPEVPDAKELPLENHTMYPRAGELLYFFQPWNGLRDLADIPPAWLRPGADVHEIVFAYGDANLRLSTENGWRGSSFAQIDEGLDAFCEACAWMRMEGMKHVTLRRLV
jgi:hypothetical protein